MQFLNIGPGEMILILVIALVVFGPGKLPEIGRSVGKSINEFRRATSDLTREFSSSIDDVKQPFDELKGAVTGTAVNTAAAVATATCPNCSAVNPASNKFCKECGGRMVQEEPTVACPACAAVNPTSNKFCKECGAAIVVAQPEPVVSQETNTWTTEAAAAPLATETAAVEPILPFGTTPPEAAPAEASAQAETVAAVPEPVAETAKTPAETAPEAAVEQPGTWHPSTAEVAEPKKEQAAKAEHEDHKQAPVAG